MAGVDPRPVMRSAPTRSRLHERLSALWPQASLRAYLAAIMLLATVPFIALMGYRIWDDFQAQRTRMWAELERTTVATAQNVERELASSIETLSIIGRTTLVDHTDPAEFAALLRDHPRPRHSWHGIFLLSAEGEVLVDATFPLGEGRAVGAQAVRELPEFRDVIDRPRPLVSNLIARGAGAFTTAIAVPVVSQGRVAYVVGAWIDFAAWQTLLQNSAPPSRWLLEPVRPQPRGGGAHQVARAFRRRAACAPDVIAATRRAQRRHASRAVARGQHAVRRMARGAVGRLGRGGRPSGGAARCRGAAIGAHGGRRRGPVRGAGPVPGVARGAPSGASARPVVAGASSSRSARRSACARWPICARRWPRRTSATSPHGSRSRTPPTSSRPCSTAARSALAFAQDPQCRVVTDNAAMDALFGKADARDALRDATAARRPAAGSAHEQPLQRACAHGRAVPPMELRGACVEGRPPRHVLAQAVPLLDAAGAPRGAIGAVVDITERVRARRS